MCLLGPGTAMTLGMTNERAQVRLRHIASHQHVIGRQKISIAMSFMCAGSHEYISLSRCVITYNLQLRKIILSIILLIFSLRRH